MKKIFNKKFLSVAAVLALSGTLVMGVGVMSACDKNNVDVVYAAPDGEFTGNVYYVAPYGKRENDGLTAQTAKDPGFMNDRQEIKAGDTIYLVPGTYKWDASWGENHSYNSRAIAITVSGTPNKNISFINAALDPRSGYTGEETKVILDFSDMEFASNNRGVQIYGDYIYWYGIDVCGAGDNGMYIGGSFNTIEYSEFYNNRDSGLQLGREASAQTNINQWPSYNLIKNCTSHNNYDDETYGENADGFAAKLTIGYGNVFDGCVAYRNSDDGWDLYAKADSGNIGCVIIYNCVAFENGYLEYTQAEMHKKLNFKDIYSEDNTDSYNTRDGDGNGFKLGGSTMEGDVKLYNCLAFQNKMHGVTDNSNPGYIMVEGVTSYDNSAAIDNNPSSATFGQVISTNNNDDHNNIDVARQDYSYNTVKNVLSIKSDIAKSVGNDEYRGSVTNSLLNAGANTNVIKGSIDADTKVSTAKKYTSRVDALKPEDVFKAVPVVANSESYTYNLSGLKDLDNPIESRVHDKYRNADHSINFGDMLAVKDDFDFSAYFDNGVTAGSYLNMTKWADYVHFTDDNIFDGVYNEVYATLLKAKETLEIYTDAEAVYQDFDVPVKLQDATIDWSTDSELLTIGRISLPAAPSSNSNMSKAEYISIGVTRPTDADTTVKLTAKISYLNRSITKDFELVIKKDEPSIGGLSVRITETDEVYGDTDKIIMDAYKQFGEPVLEVENGAYYNGTLLTAEQYDVVTVYEYAPSSTAEFIVVPAFMVNHPGVFRITHTVTLKDGSQSASMSYMIFVAATGADVDFVDGGSVSVFRDGYIIAGDLSNVTGTLYTVASETELTDLTAANIQTYAGVESYAFRATNISPSFKNANNKAYHIYYAIANVDGEITSEVRHVVINRVDISSTDDFMKIAGGEKIGNEEVSQTIYLLTKDLDFTGVTYSAKRAAFSGLLNGQGHTISNVTVNGANSDIGLFYRISGGTLMNVKFDKIRITNTSGSRTGLIAAVYGGYFHNIAITNLYVNSVSDRTGGLIGQVFDGKTRTEISQISIINPIPKLTSSGNVAEGQNENELYYISSTAHRVGGIIGLIQSQSTMTGTVEVKIEDCYVESYIRSNSYTVSSIVAEFDENGKRADALLRGADFTLTINNCMSAGVLVSMVSGSAGRIGGILGYHKGLGVLRITSCLAIHDMYYGSSKLEVAQKNQSPIIGNYNDAASVFVGRCVAMMEEYNTNYEVVARTPQEMERIYAFDDLSFDRRTKWTVVYANDPSVDDETVKAPYFILNFLGDWD